LLSYFCQTTYKYFKSCFEKHPFKYFYNQKISSHTIVGQYKEVELEINCYDDLTLRMLDETRLQNWEGLTIPVLPLPQAVFFYNKIERTSKVDLIKSSPHYLKQKNMSEVSKQYYATNSTLRL